MALFSYDIPSKLGFDLVDVILENILTQRTVKEISRTIGQHERHARFLIQNAEILKLIKKENGYWVLTGTGLDFLDCCKEEKQSILVKAVMKCNLFQELFRKLGTLDHLSTISTKQIASFLRENTVISNNRLHSISRKTAIRRASSVKKWIIWLKAHINNFQL